MPDNSFDIVSKIELPEVSNAVQQAMKEVQQRYDLKASNSNIELQEKDNKILLQSKDEFSLKAVTQILEQKLVKRNVPLKGLVHGTITPAGGSTVRQEITLQQGIPIEKARDIVKVIKDSKKKVQASIQGDLVRISSKDRDTLQEVMALLRRLAAEDGLAVLCVLHQPELAERYSDRLIGLQHGRLQFDLPSKQVSGGAVAGLYLDRAA